MRERPSEGESRSCGLGLRAVRGAHVPPQDSHHEAVVVQLRQPGNTHLTQDARFVNARRDRPAGGRVPQGRQ